MIVDSVKLPPKPGYTGEDFVREWVERNGVETALPPFLFFPVPGDTETEYVSVELHGWAHSLEVHVGWIGVSKHLRRRGHARYILETLAALADERGVTLDLSVEPKKMRGDDRPPVPAAKLRRFYESVGFRVRDTEAWKCGDRTMVRDPAP